MAAAERDTMNIVQPHSEAHVAAYSSNRAMDGLHRKVVFDPQLAEEIDRLRKEMTDIFLREHSFTADPVIELSRQLDLKINEYMKRVLINRE